MKPVSTYFDDLSEFNERNDQPQVIECSHLTTLMTLPIVEDLDCKEFAKLWRTLNGAMHALRVGGYDQDIEGLVRHVP